MGQVNRNGDAFSEPDTRPHARAFGGALAGQLARRGFTLVELMVVVVIIGIILSLVLVAGMDAANRANERATQSLITKLEQGLNDRLEALMQNQPVPNYTHGYLGSVCSSLAANTTNNTTGMIPTPFITFGATTSDNPAVKQTARAQVFAWYDYIKAEMPDVFYVQNSAPTTTGTGVSQYPFNFAGVAFLGSYNLPLGIGVAGPYVEGGYGDGVPSVSNPTLGPAGSGIFGAAYDAAAGLYKGLGYTPFGYDGVDNDGDGQIDNYNEGLTDPNGTVDPVVPSPNTPNVTMNLSALIASRLANHTHITARSEVLYALLVEGSGPLGSVFKRDDFTDKEVQDTDSDGMPEFVDAWGQPLQFFRWPVFYHSDLQRGQVILPDASTAGQYDLWPPYVDPSSPAATQYGSLQQREQDPLDPNQQLMAPAWWSLTGSGGLAANDDYPATLVATTVYVPSGASLGVQAFEALFHPLSEPLPVSTASGNNGTYWDRGTTYPSRRAFYSKFLILSAGQDQQPGVFLYADTDMASFGAGAAAYLIANENNAMPFSVADVGDFTMGPTVTNSTFQSVNSLDPTHPLSYDLQQAAQDDITNHNISTGGAIGGSG